MEINGVHPLKFKDWLIYFDADAVIDGVPIVNCCCCCCWFFKDVDVDDLVNGIEEILLCKGVWVEIIGFLRS